MRAVNRQGLFRGSCPTSREGAISRASNAHFVVETAHPPSLARPSHRFRRTFRKNFTLRREGAAPRKKGDRPFHPARTMPSREPASMERLHSVSRPSMDSARMASPAYFDGVRRRAPPVPSVGDDRQRNVLGVDAPRRGAPFDVDAHCVFGRFCQIVLRHQQHAQTSDAPIAEGVSAERNHASRCGCRPQTIHQGPGSGQSLLGAWRHARCPWRASPTPKTGRRHGRAVLAVSRSIIARASGDCGWRVDPGAVGT